MHHRLESAPAACGARHRCTYLRVVATTRCNYQCSYCHMEGDPWSGGARGLDTEALIGLSRLAVDRGIRKLKFLGGEPLLRGDLPEVVAALRAHDADVDLSCITAGAVPIERLDALIAAGLSRINVSIHGFGAGAFARRNKNPNNRTLRDMFVARALEHGRPLKLNYVVSSPDDEADLGELLHWARGRGAVVAVLDDLGTDVGLTGVMRAVRNALGEPQGAWVEPDPDSLPTLRWDVGDLVVEFKDQRLGEVAPWAACATCPVRARCGEGIFALRLTHDGQLRRCLDRPDLGVDLAGAWKAGGRAAGERVWTHFVEAP